MIQSLLDFVRGLGIPATIASLPEPTFLPGLAIRSGTLLVDPDRLRYPGDILHEAGHIAVASPEARVLSELTPDAADEIATHAWAYAAVRYLGMSPHVVFHADGYRGGANSLVENFDAGRTIGVPLLQYYGMSLEPRVAAERGLPAYPHMLRWVR